MTFDLVRYDLHYHVATVTLDRPESRNEGVRSFLEKRPPMFQGR